VRSAVIPAGALAAGAGAAPLRAENLSRRVPDELYRISLAQWSLHRTIRAGDLDPLDFATVSRERFGLEAVEYVNQFFADRSTDRDYLTRLKQRADDAGVKSLLIMCDGEGNLGDPDPMRRAQAVENHFKRVEAARLLGCHSIRVNARSSNTYEEQIECAADGLRRLAEFGDQHEMDVIVENHGGRSSNAAWLVEVIRRVDHPRAGTLPDFGNFRISATEEYDRYPGVAELMPLAKGVSAKSHAFDEEGNEVGTDYRRMMRIVLDAGYRGYVGIEYEGRQLGEAEGILATKRLLERVRTELVPHYT
jgi:L-ribulose-5-phosphate 3-epimerase